MWSGGGGGGNTVSACRRPSPVTRTDIPRARLLDLVPGRTGAAHGDWLATQGPAFTAGIISATLDPFHGYANAIRDELPKAITVLDAFHVVKLGGQVVDEVRRQVQQDTLGHHGRGGDPLYGIPRTLQIGAEHLTERQVRQLNTKLESGDPHHEVTLAWHCYQKLRAVYHAHPDQAVNAVIETMRRIARGFRNFENYRLRALLAAGGHRPWRNRQTPRLDPKGPFRASTSVRRRNRNRSVGCSRLQLLRWGSSKALGTGAIREAPACPSSQSSSWPSSPSWLAISPC